jgi:arginine exporter protein ArgO
VTGALAAGLVAGYGIAVPIGAVGTYLIALAARAGVRRGAAAALGVASADAVFALVAVLGGAALAALVEPVADPLRMVSVVVLVGIAGTIAVRALREHRRAAPTGNVAALEPASPGWSRRLGADARAYAAFLGMTLLNPMTVVYFAALVLGGQGELFTSTGERAVFVVAAAAASASWQLLLAGGGALLGRLLSGPRGRLGTGLVSAAVITALAARLL